MEDLKILNDSVSLIRENPGMYIGGTSPTGENLCELITADAEILGVNNIITESNSGWHMVSGNKDWLSSNSLQRSWSELFHQLTPLPEEGINAIRSEVILMAFSSNIFIFKDGELTIMKGNPPIKIIEELLNKKEQNKIFTIGFTIAT